MSATCSVKQCTISNNRGTFINCHACKNKLHTKCAKISDYLYTEMTNNINIAFVCDECIGDSNSSIQQLNEKVNNMEQSITKILDILGTTKNVRPPVESVKTYSQALRTSEKILVEPKTNSTQIPIDPSKVMADIKTIIDPVKTGIIQMKKTQKGALVSIDNNNNNDKKNQLELLEPNFNIKPVARLNHRFKLCGLTEKYEVNELPTIIRTQNNLPENASIKIITFLNTIKKIYFDLIIEVDPATAKTLEQKKKIIIKWDECFVYPHYRILRCLSCLEYGHLKKDCKRTAPRCFNCGEDHLHKDCLQQQQICYNCKIINTASKSNYDIKHKNFCNECPIEKRKIQLYKQKLVQNTQ